ncbi:MAG TPA: hypothetical protein VKK79_18065 [Candidatus Lokiarchaeia archaeon]|nr:hypothetical protein [Candidatus Lokiarchaeia archaeon]
MLDDADPSNNHEEEIDAALTKVATAREDFSELFQTLTAVLEETKSALNTLAKEKINLEEEKTAADHTIETMTGEQKRLLEEYTLLQEDLKRMSGVVKEADQKEFNFKEVQAVLSIYTVLLEQVWQSQPHFKVLYLLHGQKEEISRQDLANASGISAAMIMRAIFELRNANLVYYDEDTGMVKLVRRFLGFNTDELDKPVEADQE